jgi:large subunit ribosomal protein L3
MSLSNSLGLLGRKVGMMRLFTDDGDAVPVTVVDVSNNRVTQVKTQTWLKPKYLLIKNTHKLQN